MKMHGDVRHLLNYKNIQDTCFTKLIQCDTQAFFAAIRPDWRRKAL